MKITEIKEIAKQHNLKFGKATKSELLRSIQEAEGNQQCLCQQPFRRVWAAFLLMA